MPAESWSLRSWLKATPSTKTTPPARLGCEQLEDRLTPSAAPLPYVPPSYFFLDQTQAPAPANGAPLANALAYLNAHSADFGLTATDLAQSRVTDLYTDSNTGITHIYLRQTINGLEVENANINVSVAASGRVLTAGGGYVAGLSGLIGPGAPTPGITALQAVQFAADELGIASAGSIQMTAQPSGIDRSTVISAPGVSLDPITARLHYVPTANGSAELAWQLIIRTTDFDHWYDLSIDASSGGLATLVDWTEDAIYNVIAAPNEDPQDGGFTVQIDPHNPLASPDGWHDDDGDPTFPEYTDTRGNNVHAQLDHDNNNVADGTEGGQVRPDGGLFLDFTGFLFNPALNAESIQNANIAQINLFTAINFAHDVHYMYGFDEVAGNFQTNNYGNGGLGGDAVQADAQDGFDNGDRNNANFATPPDGRAPRMQQYIFDLSNPTRDSDLDIGVIFHEFG